MRSKKIEKKHEFEIMEFLSDGLEHSKSDINNGVRGTVGAICAAIARLEERGLISVRLLGMKHLVSKKASEAPGKDGPEMTQR